MRLVKTIKKQRDLLLLIQQLIYPRNTASISYSDSDVGHADPITDRGRTTDSRMIRKISSSMLSFGPRNKRPKNKISVITSVILDIFLIFFIDLTLILICFYF